ncbi:hypothetical protein GCM10022225_04770 [Plantactinospora mayteni]|uniref:VCBS repeat-containing protein n=1 Tax=Plantactinospora mayteni TaxID=566021 RepID=A0ABQ4EQN2_9ACTN|nr:Ig-like domain-containing protein [Plantactinospora mayteni]GIG96966.1 hypothetical protein Pma05_35390 [Plantactinospora mayteni]
MRNSRLAAAIVALLMASVGGLARPAYAGGPGDPILGDLDGDGLLDRARLRTDPSDRCVVLVESGRAGSGYGAAVPHEYALPNGGGCPDLGVAVDLDRDGRAELVVGRYGGLNGRNAPDLVVLRDFRMSVQLDGLAKPNALGRADFNADGLLDVYGWTDQGQGFASYLNTGTGTLVPGPVRYCARSLQYGLADFDRNGATDLAIAYRDGCTGQPSQGVAVVLDDGTVVQLLGGDDGSQSRTVHVLDANTDGMPDVIAYYQRTTPITTFLSLGDGTFAASPLAVPDQMTVSVQGSTRIAALANDQISTRATVDIVSPPAAGAVEVNPDRSITYTPDGSSNATDRFVYRISQDGRTSDAPVTLVIVR